MCKERNWPGWRFEGEAIRDYARGIHRDTIVELGMQTLKDGMQYSKLVERLPVTFRPFINEKLAGMDRLFEFERKSFETFLSFLENLTPGDFELLFKHVRTVEKKMNVERWTFSLQGETLENTSLLAHSPFYQEWRQAVQGVFDEVSRQTHSTSDQIANMKRRQLILIILPRFLPVKREIVWNDWPLQGRQLTLAPADFSNASCSETLLGKGDAGLLSIAARAPGNAAEDLWVLDADSTLKNALPEYGDVTRPTNPATYLSYAELAPFREVFRDRLNWVQKDLADADKVIATLRQTDVSGLCPRPIKNQIATREFVKELFLSGNGSVVFGNAFVQWAASEAFRRARPRVMVACFGLRNRPKPFTSIAILEDQEHTSPLPDTADPEGSAVDAQILARYIWLSASRYEEYENAVCLCVADSVPAIYAIAPLGHGLFGESEPMTVEKIRGIIEEWVS